MSEVRYATFDPETFVATQGMLDDADVIVRNPKFAHFTYPGTSTTTTALVVDLEDGEGKLHNQPYSVGSPEKYAPSDDGSKVLLTGTSAIDPKSNFGQFIRSLINAGAPKASFQTDDIKVLDGLRIHVKAFPVKDKDGNTVKNAKGFDRTILLATKLIALPGQAPAAAAAGAPKAPAAPKAPGAPKAAAAAKPAAAAAPTLTDEQSDKVVRYLSQVAEGQGGSVLRAKVSTLAYQAAMAANDPDKQLVMKTVFDEGFLTANSGRSVLEGETVYAFEYDAATKTISKAA